MNEQLGQDAPQAGKCLLAVVKDHDAPWPCLLTRVFQTLLRTHLRIVIVGEHIPKDRLYSFCRKQLVLFLFYAPIGWAEEATLLKKLQALPSRMDIFWGRSVPAVLVMHAVSAEEMALCAHSSHQVRMLLHILSDEKKSGLRVELL